MSEHACGSIFIRDCGEPMKAGEATITHAHRFDHTTFINHGAARIEKLIPTAFDEQQNPIAFTVEREIEKKAYEAKNWVLVNAGIWHRITALEDGTTYVCVYSHRRPDTEEPVPEYTGWQAAYG